MLGKARREKKKIPSATLTVDDGGAVLREVRSTGSSLDLSENFLSNTPHQRRRETPGGHIFPNTISVHTVTQILRTRFNHRGAFYYKSTHNVYIIAKSRVVWMCIRICTRFFARNRPITGCFCVGTSNREWPIPLRLLSQFGSQNYFLKTPDAFNRVYNFHIAVNNTAEPINFIEFSTKLIRALQNKKLTY